jgi:hypothetical protein
MTWTGPFEHSMCGGKQEMHAGFSWRNMKHESQVDKHYINKHCADATNTAMTAAGNDKRK